jgi:hypothetical protein
MPSELTWRKAIDTVLASATTALHYNCPQAPPSRLQICRTVITSR